MRIIYTANGILAYPAYSAGGTGGRQEFPHFIQNSKLKFQRTDCPVSGTFTDVFTKQPVKIEKNSVFKMKAWDYLVVEK